MTITPNDHTEQILIKQIEEEIIDMDFVSGLSGERWVSDDEKEHIAKVMERRGEAIYHDLLFTLTLLDYPADQARILWDSILQHQQKMKQQLQRDPGIIVTALDFFTNIASSPDNTFAILPQNKFDTIIQRAAVDGLTRMYDHESFYSMLKKEVQRAQRYHQILSLLMIDIDDFKEVNDKLGHQRGDEVLIKVAAIIKDSLRDMDSCGRYGGEEFAVLLPLAKPDYAVSVAERIRTNIRTIEIDDCFVSVSIGVASYPADGADIEKLIAASDKALYHAKHTGKNRVCLSPTV